MAETMTDRAVAGVGQPAVEFARPLYERILSHALAELPNEACGVVAGRDGRAERVYPIRNAEASPTRYRFDEREQIRVFAAVEDAGLELLAFFHSHTDTDAYPSPTDRAQAHWRDPVTGDATPAYPDTVYLIVSLQDRERPDVRGYRFAGGEPAEVEVTIR